MEETTSKKDFYENLLFALLGAMTAVIMGLSIFESEGLNPRPYSRHPATVASLIDPTWEKIEPYTLTSILD